MARALWAWTIFLATVVLVAKATIGNFDDSCFNDTIYDLKYTENFTWTADFEVEQDMLSATVLGLAVDLSHPRIGALEVISPNSA